MVFCLVTNLMNIQAVFQGLMDCWTTKGSLLEQTTLEMIYCRCSFCLQITTEDSYCETSTLSTDLKVKKQSRMFWQFPICWLDVAQRCVCETRSPRLVIYGQKVKTTTMSPPGVMQGHRINITGWSFIVDIIWMWLTRRCHTSNMDNVPYTWKVTAKLKFASRRTDQINLNHQIRSGVRKWINVILNSKTYLIWNQLPWVGKNEQKKREMMHCQGLLD